ncbi:hypothetical protein CEXT_160471 [Caerostris extrusa]|uniref:Uncharacterized protein n=1 Tax=Caerostris extrusa TaxID=172846 RepID=A0AAV4PEY7_CAEEX|nr:hypothetical protein CEXT_160471 [Caerostris extrusa]
MLTCKCFHFGLPLFLGCSLLVTDALGFTVRALSLKQRRQMPQEHSRMLSELILFSKTVQLSYHSLKLIDRKGHRLNSPAKPIVYDSLAIIEPRNHSLEQSLSSVRQMILRNRNSRELQRISRWFPPTILVTRMDLTEINKPVKL